MARDATERDADAEPPGSDTGTHQPEPDVSPCHEAYLERHDHRPDSCTIYSSATVDAARDRWVKAWGDAFVSREDAR